MVARFREEILAPAQTLSTRPKDGDPAKYRGIVRRQAALVATTIAEHFRDEGQSVLLTTYLPLPSVITYQAKLARP